MDTQGGSWHLLKRRVRPGVQLPQRRGHLALGLDLPRRRRCLALYLPTLHSLGARTWFHVSRVFTNQSTAAAQQRHSHNFITKGAGATQLRASTEKGSPLVHEVASVRSCAGHSTPGLLRPRHAAPCACRALPAASPPPRIGWAHALAGPAGARAAARHVAVRHRMSARRCSRRPLRPCSAGARPRRRGPPSQAPSPSRQAARPVAQLDCWCPLSVGAAQGRAVH